MTGRDTRSRKTVDDPAITEEDLRAFHKQLAEREQKVRDEERRFEQDRVEFEKLEREKENLKIEVERMRLECEKANPAAPSLDRVPTATTMPLPESPRRETRESYEYTLKEAVNTIPLFDGANITALQFSRACRRARDIVPPQAEQTLARLIITRLRGRAALALEDELCDSVTAVCNRLKDVFEPRRSVDHFRGEMANVFYEAKRTCFGLHRSREGFT